MLAPLSSSLQSRAGHPAQVSHYPITYVMMKQREKHTFRIQHVKIAVKRIRCYDCGVVIEIGETFVQRDLVRCHYPVCPPIKAKKTYGG
jgi:hypothetical protein